MNNEIYLKIALVNSHVQSIIIELSMALDDMKNNIGY